MSDAISILINLNEADLDLSPARLEQYAVGLIREIDDLVESSCLVRDEEMPSGAMSGEGKFNLGFLSAEVNLDNLKRLFDRLGNIFYGNSIEFSYEENGLKVWSKYKKGIDFEKHIEAVERLSKLQALPETLTLKSEEAFVTITVVSQQAVD